MKKTEWHDARVEKPKTYNDGLSDLVLCLTDDGLVIVAEWNGTWWYDPERDETFGNVVWWFDFPVPSGFKFSDLYERRAKE